MTTFILSYIRSHNMLYTAASETDQATSTRVVCMPEYATYVDERSATDSRRLDCPLLAFVCPVLLARLRNAT